MTVFWLPLLLSLAGAAPVALAPVSQASADPGARAFQRCAACHALAPGRSDAADEAAPALQGVFGRRAGTLAGFAYSEAMRAAGRGGLVWNAATLDRYLADPEAAVPGTHMPYQGGSAAERAAVIDWLRRAG